MVRNVPAIFKGEHLKMRETSQMKVRNVVFECENTRELGVDGDLHAQTPVYITVLPRELSLISTRHE